jgi:hypothetical protein
MLVGGHHEYPLAEGEAVRDEPRQDADELVVVLVETDLVEEWGRSRVRHDKKPTPKPGLDNGKRRESRILTSETNVKGLFNCGSARW